MFVVVSFIHYSAVHAAYLSSEYSPSQAVTPHTLSNMSDAFDYFSTYISLLLFIYCLWAKPYAPQCYLVFKHFILAGID